MSTGLPRSRVSAKHIELLRRRLERCGRQAAESGGGFCWPRTRTCPPEKRLREGPQNDENACRKPKQPQGNPCLAPGLVAETAKAAVRTSLGAMNYDRAPNWFDWRRFDLVGICRGKLPARVPNRYSVSVRQCGWRRLGLHILCDDRLHPLCDLRGDLVCHRPRPVVAGASPQKDTKQILKPPNNGSTRASA